MARKKKTKKEEEEVKKTTNETPEENEEETPEEESIEDILKKDATEDEEGDKNGEKEEEEENKEELVEEKEEEETPPEKSQEEKDKETQEQINKTKEDLISSMRKSFGLDTMDEKKIEEEDLTPPWEKEKRAPKSYREVAEYSSKLTEYRQKEQQKQAEEANKLQQKRVEEENKKINQQWDQDLEDLRSQGKLPAIGKNVLTKLKKGEALSEEDKSDPGLKAQGELIQTMYKVAQTRTANKQEPITNIKEIYYEHYKPDNKDKPKQPAGADSPVSGGARAVEQDKGPVKYEEIRGSNFYDILGESND